MTKIEKLWIKICSNPCNIRFREIETFFIHQGFKSLRQKGSHVIFLHPDTQKAFIIPKRSTVKRVYIKQIIQYFQSQ